MQHIYRGKYTQKTVTSRPVLHKTLSSEVAYLANYQKPTEQPEFLYLLIQNRKIDRSDIFVYGVESKTIEDHYQFQNKNMQFLNYKKIYSKIDPESEIAMVLSEIGKKYERNDGAVILSNEFDIELDVEKGTWVCSFIDPDEIVPCTADFGFEVPVDNNGKPGKPSKKQIKVVERRTRSYNNSRRIKWREERVKRFEDNEREQKEREKREEKERALQKEEEEKTRKLNEEEQQRQEDIAKGQKAGTKGGKAEQETKFIPKVAEAEVESEVESNTRNEAQAAKAAEAQRVRDEAQKARVAAQKARAEAQAQAQAAK